MRSALRSRLFLFRKKVSFNYISVSGPKYSVERILLALIAVLGFISHTESSHDLIIIFYYLFLLIFYISDFSFDFDFGLSFCTLCLAVRLASLG